MNTLIVSGKTIEDAIKNGLAQWKVTEDRVTVRVLEKPSRGLFGLIGVRPATVELTLLEKPEAPAPAPETTPAPAAEVKAEPAEEAAISAVEAAAEEEAAQQGPDPIEEAKRFIIDAARAMGLEVDVSVHKRKDTVTFDISGPDLGLIIGRRGQTLDSLQYLTSLVANRYSKHHLRIILDAEQFRERRKKTLEALADRLANKAVRNHQDVVLEPMTPQERKIIHAKLQDHPKVKTYSKGEEPNRRIVISVK
ncbi:protein jag [Paenibacillus melissococcoides]|uniref:RNA-binding protein KhpB n=1 Tax=Paenibacillus melissococcoides TaxID=2912268 RepID=A0ABM9G8Y9_9BACL|nr:MULTISPECIES: RNA-binding cell elongation regulator Jag/EloR [Paenibacillus]MEB9894463.1 RNA-binding cell elongation regulator Jag/EloR [Bacillus cereus]CAH8247692.1 protein jag [Paenibacillus melissococcoides]CAH8705680.1 protein jag [Paenibacillus melissococcoides]CAH8715153.1 protein jag [Paenibacillus melissococcoides]GIO81176.1 Jag protein [Paenibacillus dendritiformis]